MKVTLSLKKWLKEILERLIERHYFSIMLVYITINRLQQRSTLKPQIDLFVKLT